MTVSDLVTKLLALPQHLDVHVMVDDSSDLANIAYVEFIGGQPMSEGDPFVVLELSHTKGAGTDTIYDSSLKISG